MQVSIILNKFLTPMLKWIPCIESDFQSHTDSNHIYDYGFFSHIGWVICFILTQTILLDSQKLLGKNNLFRF